MAVSGGDHISVEVTTDRSPSPITAPTFSRAPATVQTSYANLSIPPSKKTLNGSFEGEGGTTAKDLLRNVKMDDQHDLDAKKRAAKLFGKKTSPALQRVPENSSYYFKKGIVYSNSPGGCETLSPFQLRNSGERNDSPLEFAGKHFTLPRNIGRRWEGDHSSINRPVSCYAPMGMSQGVIHSQASSSEGSLPFQVGGIGVRVVENGSPKEASLHPSMGGTQKPSPPINLNEGVKEDSASSPDSGYGNTPENRTGAGSTNAAAKDPLTQPPSDSQSPQLSQTENSPPDSSLSRFSHAQIGMSSSTPAPKSPQKLQDRPTGGSLEDISREKDAEESFGNWDTTESSNLTQLSKITSSSPELTRAVINHSTQTSTADRPSQPSFPHSPSSSNIQEYLSLGGTPSLLVNENEPQLRTPASQSLLPLPSYQVQYGHLSTSGNNSPPLSSSPSQFSTLANSSVLSDEGAVPYRSRSRRLDHTPEMVDAMIAMRRRQRSQSQPLVKCADVKAPPTVSVAMETKDYFQVTDELSKENSHFALSEALLAVVEQYKANCAEQLMDDAPLLPPEEDNFPDSTGISQLPGLRRYHGSCSSWGSRDGTTLPDEDYLSSEVSPRRIARLSLLELMQSPAGDNSAESTAQKLLKHVAGQLTGHVGDDLSVSQIVLRLPTEFVTSLQMDEDLQRSITTSSAHMRGNKEWAPPRAQIIFHIKLPSKSIQRDLAAQGFRCTGCGMKVDPAHSRYFRFCNYTGKYFCQNCHTNATCIIPAYIISRWSFKKLYVSNFARDLLARIHHDAVFNVYTVNSQVYNNVHAMALAKELRMQLVSVKQYLRSCRRAQSLHATFERYSPWTTDIHTYSLEDFVQLKSGTKMRHLRAILIDAIQHIKTCPICKGKGFVCEFCRSMNDVIYPFETLRVSTCKVCQCCFHKECFTDKRCPRCIRVQRRQRERLRKIVYEANTDEDTSEQPS